MNDRQFPPRFVLGVLAAALCAALFTLFFTRAPLSRAAPTEEAVAMDPLSKQKPRTTPQPKTPPRPYTLLLVGVDGASGSTDTMLVLRFDTAAHTIDAVNLPRDTYCNLDWTSRKLNSVYAATVNAGGNGMEGLKAQVRALCGFDVDHYALVTLQTLEQCFDLMGGVYYDVPQDMDYTDSEQDLSIHIPAGYQKLNGQQCLWLCRYRSGYLNGDLDRIGVQQDFLKAAASQFLTLGKLPNVRKVVKLLSEELETDLSAANIAYFLRQGLQCKSEDIRFATMPNIPREVAGLSYTFVDLEPWLALLNSTLDPFDAPIEAGMLDLVYLEGGSFRSTSGVIRGSTYLYR